MDAPHPKIGFVIPVHDHFEYARACVASLLTYSPWVTPVIVDDASQGWAGYSTSWFADLSVDHFIQHKTNQGLTAAWNSGLHRAAMLGCEYLVAGNSDLLLTPGWWKALVAASQDFAFVGPVSNAPGVTSKGMQAVERWYPKEHEPYQLTDDRAYLERTAERLYNHYHDYCTPAPINGFMLFGSSANWRRFGHDPKNGFYFPPRIDVMPSGRRNPWPLMCGQEDFLNAKVRKACRRTGVAVGSFIWHYRSVTRGPRFKTAGSFRKKVEA